MRTLVHRAHRHIHRHLKLQHHRHTGRVLHHKHTSYRALAVVFVLAGTVMLAAAWAQRAAADSLFGVTAMVQSPVPTSAAIITTPSPGTTVTSKDILVAGSCPVISPQVTVALSIDGQEAGSANCDTNNNFAMPVILTGGAHILVAHVYTNTFGQGPDSTPVSVSYQPTKTLTAAPALTLSSASPFTVIAFDRNVSWNGSINGGTAPYNVLVDWGDGSRDSYTAAAADQRFNHRYDVESTHTIRLAVSDRTGKSTQLQYAVASYVTPAPAAAASVAKPSIGPMVAGLYGLFLTVLSISCIIWLEAKHAARQEAMAT